MQRDGLMERMDIYQQHMRSGLRRPSTGVAPGALQGIVSCGVDRHGKQLDHRRTPHLDLSKPHGFPDEHRVGVGRHTGGVRRQWGLPSFHTSVRSTHTQHAV